MSVTSTINHLSSEFLDTENRLKEPLLQRLLNKQSEIAVVGLGYVGLPIALEFASYFKVAGFDINEERVKQMRNGEDPSNEIPKERFDNEQIRFEYQLDKIKEASFFVVAVPTPIDEFNQPDLRALRLATQSVGKVLKTGDIVVFESTVYPGCTEEVCVPILEAESGLKYNEDFKVGYSPERFNSGDKVHTIDRITKIVSGSDKDALKTIAEVYGLIIKAGIHKAPTIKVAEAAKIVENTQRDVNIALMNELSMIFDKAGINTFDVLKAASTKWNFLDFVPGLVGGHCIGVDPYYLIQRSIRLGHNPILISAGRSVNNAVTGKIASKIIAALRKKGIKAQNAKILVQGITFKENVSDIRNSKSAELVQELMRYGAIVEVVDPIANAVHVQNQYGFAMMNQAGRDYDVILATVAHSNYTGLSEDYYQSIGTKDAIFFDVKGMMRGKIHEMTYLSL